MTAARALGFERVEAARFSLLLAIPAILGAGSLAGYDLYESGNVALGEEALVGALLAFGVALLAIVLMIGWLKRAVVYDYEDLSLEDSVSPSGSESAVPMNQPPTPPAALVKLASGLSQYRTPLPAPSP